MGQLFKRTPLTIPENWNAKSRLLVMNIDRMFQELEQAMKQVNESCEILTAGSVQRNTLYRGKNFGTITADNIDAFVTDHEIANGKFTDLYLGDYFVIQDGTYNAEWMIAGFDLDYGYRKSSSAVVDFHSITVIPRKAGVCTGRMHSSNSTAGGIANSEIYTTLGTIGTALAGVLGSHMVGQQATLWTACDENGKPTTMSTGVTSERPILMTAVEVFGVLFPDSSVSANVNTSGSDKLPVFNIIGQGKFDNEHEFWMDTPVSGTEFACTRWGGYGPYRASASDDTKWIRPKLAIG